MPKIVWKKLLHLLKYVIIASFVSVNGGVKVEKKNEMLACKMWSMHENKVKVRSIMGLKKAKKACQTLLILPLYGLQYMAMNRSSCSCQLMGYFSKLQQLNFHFWGCKVD